jgi:hypothetical protein
MKWIIISSLLLTSCSANWHLQKAIKKDPSLIQNRTVVHTDTLVLPEKVIIDTLEVPTLGQWTNWENDSLRIELSLVKDSVSGRERIVFKTKIKEQVITREVKVECPPVVVAPASWHSRLSIWALFLIAIVFSYGVGYLRGRLIV